MYRNLSIVSLAATMGCHPEGIAISAAGSAYVGSVTSGQIVSFDNCSGDYQEFVPPSGIGVRIDASGDAIELTTISLDRPLVLPDGLKTLGDNSLLVVEGGSKSLSTIALTGDSGVVTVGNSDFDSPTTVAQFGDQTWVVQGQFDHLTGKDPTPAKLPFVVVRTTSP